MELQNIERLIEKYLAGETDLKEENQLRAYFKNTVEIPEHLKVYKMIFSFYNTEREKTYENEIFLPKPRPYKRYIGIGAVAAIIIALLIWRPFKTQNSTQIDSQTTLQNSKGVLMMMGNTVRDGKASLNYLEILDTLQIIKKNNHSKNQ